MKTLEQLLTAWEEETFTADDAEQLKKLLATQEARAQLVGDWLLYEAINGTLCAEQTQTAEAVAPATSPFRASVGTSRLPLKPVAPKRTRRWLVWYEISIPLRWILGAGVAACLALAAIYFFSAPSRSVVEIAFSRANVLIERDHRQLPAQRGQALRTGDLVRVPAGGSALVAWKTEATQLEIGPNSELQILRPTGAKWLGLSNGMLRATVARQRKGAPMTITTPQAEARVVGTRFALAVSASATRLEVAEGAVEMRKTGAGAGKAVVTVGPGQFAVASPGKDLAVEFFAGFLLRELMPLATATATNRNVFNMTSGKGLRTTNLLAILSNRFNPTDTNLYVQRIPGYLTAPATGDYYFWITSGTSSELWLSSDDDPTNTTRIAFVPELPSGGRSTTRSLTPGQTPPAVAADLNEEWNRFASQKSPPQRLTAGTRYYLEIVHQSWLGDFVAVGWSKPKEPSGSPSEIVPGAVLSPFGE